MFFLLFTLIGVVLPIFFGTLLLPFTPYFVRQLMYKNKKLPSLVPFWITIIPLVVTANIIWTHKLNGTLFYEWDHMFVQYSLLSYESPILDGSNTWIAPGWNLWMLYFLWIGITVIIYSLSMTVALFLNRKHEHFIAYKKVLLASCVIMLIFGAAIALFYSHVFFV
jgi:hypothetical protein